MLQLNQNTATDDGDFSAKITPFDRNPLGGRPDAEHWRIVGNSAALCAVLADVESVAPTQMPVLVVGETGTGKDLLARRLHDLSNRASGPWVRVDCTTLAANLMETELFGHVRGAFTGASGPRTGRAMLAHGGTLFLDEIGELPLEQQGKLLRLIQEKEFEPVGSSRTVKVDVRIVAATNRDLATEVAAGRFREDLYYRLAGFPLCLPPLRDRREDIPTLVEYLLRRQKELLGGAYARPAANVMAALQRHTWPGNIRELRTVIERACVRARGRAWAPGDFDVCPQSMTVPRRSEPSRPAALPRTMLEVEREHLQAMLAYAGGIVEGRDGAAAILGMAPSTLRFRIRRLGIQPAAFRRSPTNLGT